MEYQEVLIVARQRGNKLSEDEAVLANASWGDIKHDPLVSKPFREASKRDRDRVASQAEEALFAEAQGAPDRGIFRAPGDDPRTFRVNASVSEIPEDFRMRVDERPSRECKACRTEVEVLQTGFYRGQLVTKLLMRCVSIRVSLSPRPAALLSYDEALFGVEVRDRRSSETPDLFIIQKLCTLHLPIRWPVGTEV